MTFKALLICFIIVEVTSSFKIGRIVGGKTAVPGQFPYQVSLQWGRTPQIPEKHFCGGSILDSKWILTSAYCIQKIPPVGRVLVKAGKYNISKTESGEQQVLIKRIFVYQNYTRLGIVPNDIGLILLSKPLVLNKNVSKIGLPRQGATYRGNVTLSGWGSVSVTNTPSMPSLLQYVTLPLINLARCRRAVRNIIPTATVHITSICTGPLTGELTSCSGDNGGPLVLKQNDQTIIVGVVSWVNFPCGAYGAPSVYTRTSAFTNWITAIIKDNS